MRKIFNTALSSVVFISLMTTLLWEKRIVLKNERIGNFIKMELLQLVLLFFFIGCSLLSYSQNAFYNLGKSYMNEGNYDEAIRLIRQSLEIDNIDSNKYNILLDYHVLCESYSYKKQADSCKTYAEKIIDLWKDVEGVEYTDIINNLSHYYHQVGFHQQAIDYRKKLVELVKKQYGINSPRLIGEYRILCSFLKDSGDKENAVKYAKEEECLAYNIRLNGDKEENSISFEDSFEWLLFVIEDCDEPIAGIHYILKCLNDHKDAIDEASREHALNTIWAISRDNDFLEGCLIVYKEATLHGNPKDKLTNLINLYVEDKNLSKDVNAANYAQSLFDLTMKDELPIYFNSDDIDYLLSFLPTYYSTIGLTRKSFEIAKKSYEYRIANNLELSFSDISVLLSASSIKEEAIYAVDFGENILKSNRYANDDDNLRIIYDCLAKAYQNIGDIKNAELYLSKAKDPNDYKTLGSKALYYFQNRDMKSLLPVALQLNKYKNVSDKDREFNIWMLMYAARDARNKDVLLKYAHEYVDTYRHSLLTNIPLMSEDEQANFIKSSIFKDIISFDFFIGINNQGICWSAAKEAYDYTLLMKSVLLTSQKEFRNVIKNSSDSMIVEKWNSLQRSNGKFSLQNEINKRELVKYASQTSSYINKLSYTWNDVKNALKEDEVAIEIVRCSNSYSLSDFKVSPKYVALIVRKDYDEPLTVVLSAPYFWGDLKNEELLATDDLGLYEKIWKPLEPYISDVSTVYFSPIEELNTIAIEYASMGNGQRVCNQWKLIRLSSTREIIDHKDNPIIRDAILFGGLKYDVDKDDLIEESRAGNYHPKITQRAVIPENLRYGVDDLPGTLKEVEEISNLFSTRPQLITGISGTEESFKSLNGSHYDIIHLATHGFFWDEDDAQKRSYVTFLNPLNNAEQSTEDKALMRSGLFFSGANIGLKGEALPGDIEDGVLTALELSNMNLGNVDMVVMSACESGLGETSGEGVFGLQRGFKLAGANTLLMSLWKVDDTATQKLMTEFYKHYLSGKSKQESLKLAQQKLRKSRDYSDPKYWAAFIFLDALN